MTHTVINPQSPIIYPVTYDESIIDHRWHRAGVSV
jgi:hypothetical protein